MIMTTEVRSPFCLNEASFTHAREGLDLQIVAIGLLSFDEKHRQLLEDQKKDDDRSSSASSFEFNDSVTDEAVISLIQEHNQKKTKTTLKSFVVSRPMFTARNMASTVNPEQPRDVQQRPPLPPPRPRILHKIIATMEGCYQHPTLFIMFANLHYIAYKTGMRVFFTTLGQRSSSYVSILVTVMCLAAWKTIKSRIFFLEMIYFGNCVRAKMKVMLEDGYMA